MNIEVKRQRRNLPFPPSVRAEDPAGQSASSDVVDLHGQVLGSRTLARLHLAKEGIRDVTPSGDFGEGKGEIVPGGDHTGSMDTLSLFRNRCPHGLFVPGADHEGMAKIWAHWDNFRDAVTWCREEFGMSRADVALAMELSPQSLDKYMADKTRRPGEDKLRNLVTLTKGQYKMADFWDYPDVVPDGLNPQEFAGTTEETRVDLRTVAADMQRLSPAQREIAMNTWKAVVQGMLTQR